MVRAAADVSTAVRGGWKRGLSRPCSPGVAGSRTVSLTCTVVSSCLGRFSAQETPAHPSKPSSGAPRRAGSPGDASGAGPGLLHHVGSGASHTVRPLHKLARA